MIGENVQKKDKPNICFVKNIKSIDKKTVLYYYTA